MSPPEAWQLAQEKGDESGRYLFIDVVVGDVDPALRSGGRVAHFDWGRMNSVLDASIGEECGEE